ncbi:MAG: hypothetical protein HKM06_09005 [Spirochaetales bacterium]|nr:hypothetical protein [Spirochaetales bacterium]
MDFLEKKITADWIDIREKMTAPPRMKSYLQIPDESLSLTAQDLRNSIPGGPSDYKRRSIVEIFSFLSRLSHQSPAQEEILERENVLRQLIFVNCQEYQFATGVFKPQGEEDLPKEGGGKPPRMPLDRLIADVMSRLQASPDWVKDPRVKNVLMEIQLYKKEYEQFKALSPKIPDERAPGFLANFRQRIEGIVKTIYNYYEEMLALERAPAEVSSREDDLFLIPGLGRLLVTQTQELSLIRSTIQFALQEGYQIRVLLLRLTAKKDPLLALVDEEAKLLENAKRQNPGQEVALRLAKNLAAAVEGNTRKI